MSGNWVGHAISMASILVTVFVGAMWVGALDQKVDRLRADAIIVSDGRIARLEQRIDGMDRNTQELKATINTLVLEVRRNPP